MEGDSGIFELDEDSEIEDSGIGELYSLQESDTSSCSVEALIEKKSIKNKNLKKLYMKICFLELTEKEKMNF